MSQVAQFGLASFGLLEQPSLGIRCRFMGLVLSLFLVKVDLSARPGWLSLPVLPPETLMAGPSLHQRSVYREMFVRHKRTGSLQHPPEKQLRNLFVQQSLPILAVHRVIPDRLVHLHPYKPPEQQVVLQLLDQHSFAAYRIEDLQQQGPKQPLRRSRRAPYLRVQFSKVWR